jgi:hypothetical protein
MPHGFPGQQMLNALMGRPPTIVHGGLTWCIHFNL